jgi:uncharacterized protein (TIGR02246 family)
VDARRSNVLAVFPASLRLVGVILVLFKETPAEPQALARGHRQRRGIAVTPNRRAGRRRILRLVVGEGEGREHMRAPGILVAAAALLLPSGPGSADQAEDAAAIREVVKQVNARHNEHDVEALVALFDEKVEDWAGGTQGRKAMEETLTDLFAREPNRLQQELEEIGIVFVTPDVAIYKSRRVTTGTVDAKGAPLPPQRVQFARILVRREGRWYLAAWFGSPVAEE